MDWVSVDREYLNNLNNEDNNPVGLDIHCACNTGHEEVTVCLKLCFC